MKLLSATACALLGLSGCLSTHHVEYHRVATTGVAPDGTVQTTRQGKESERNWHGPWVLQPDRARP